MCFLTHKSGFWLENLIFVNGRRKRESWKASCPPPHCSSHHRSWTSSSCCRRLTTRSAHSSESAKRSANRPPTPLTEKNSFRWLTIGDNWVTIGWDKEYRLNWIKTISLLLSMNMRPSQRSERDVFTGTESLRGKGLFQMATIFSSFSSLRFGEEKLMWSVGCPQQDEDQRDVFTWMEKLRGKSLFQMATNFQVFPLCFREEKPKL